MRELLDKDPIDWLRNPPIPISPIHTILSGFTPPLSVVRFTGPHIFYRVAGWDETKGKRADPYGCWWIDEITLNAIYTKIARLDMFEGWMPPEILARITALPMHYRALTAVCEDWNNLQEQVALRLPAGEQLIGLCGTIARQPFRSSMNRSSGKTPWLPGGVEQVFFKRATATEANINPLWVYWINLW